MGAQRECERDSVGKQPEGKQRRPLDTSSGFGQMSMSQPIPATVRVEEIRRGVDHCDTEIAVADIGRIPPDRAAERELHNRAFSDIDTSATTLQDFPAESDGRFNGSSATFSQQRNPTNV